MTKEISTNPNVFVETIEVNGAKLRRVKAKGLVCVRDVLNEIGIQRAEDWIERLKLLASNRSTVSNRTIILEYYATGHGKKASFTNEAGLVEILGGSRKRESKIKLHEIINALKERITTCPYCSTDLESKQKILSFPADMNDNGCVNLMVADWIRRYYHCDQIEDPKKLSFLFEITHERINENFRIIYGKNISLRSKRLKEKRKTDKTVVAKSALQIAVDMGKGKEIKRLTEDLVVHNFNGYFEEQRGICNRRRLTVRK